VAHATRRVYQIDEEHRTIGIQQIHLGSFDVDEQKLFLRSQVVQYRPSANIANFNPIRRIIHLSQRSQSSNNR
jgi:hypothetical protein